ncbi:MAG: signal peptidase I [Chloroflexi bacterium RBG_13_50_21]|nr:MAG: signal peptidase I [Chloroflexi bacterium RBG_13_50_21]
MDTNQIEVIPELPQNKAKRSGFLSFLVDVLETLVLSVVLFVSINMISARIRVDGASMEPTLVSGEYVIVSRLSYRLGSPQRGDIIVFHFPRDPKEEYIKRIIGLPGDEVEVRNGSVYVNGQPLTENYLNVKMNYMGTWRVPEDQLFVLGDNRNNSSDSHDWGMVPMDYVVGKALVVYWPPPAWGLIDHVPLANAAH